MRVLAVTPHFAPEGGGLERYAGTILGRLAARGHDVEAVAMTCTGLPDAECQGVPVRRLPARLRVGNTPIDPAFGKAVERAVWALSPEVVLAHTPVPFAAETAYRVASRQGIPFVTTYHAGRLHGSSPVLEGVAAVLRLTMERRMLAGSAHLIAVGPFVRDHALARHRERVTVVPPGVDPEMFWPEAPSNRPEILFVGPLDRSYRWKGVDVLLQAFQLVRARIPGLRLRLVGEGDRVEEFRHLAQMDDAVMVEGRVDDAGLVQAYHRSSVVVLPSTSDAEAFGMVLAEANACGRPVVASRVGGVPDFVRPGDNGLLVRPGDVEDLATKLLTVLRDPEHARRMGERGRTRVLREHDWDKLARRTEQVLRTVAARPAWTT